MPEELKPSACSASAQHQLVRTTREGCCGAGRLLPAGTGLLKGPSPSAAFCSVG